MAHIVKGHAAHKYRRLNDWQLYCRCGYVIDAPEPGASGAQDETTDAGGYHASDGTFADTVWAMVLQPDKPRKD